MDIIERSAKLSILRALGFAGLAIGTVMVGFSYDMALSLQAGAAFSLLTTAVLVWKGLGAPTRNVRQTEVWIMLDGKLGMPKEHAQRIVGGLLRRLYFRYAQITMGFATGLWLAGLGLRAFA